MPYLSQEEVNKMYKEDSNEKELKKLKKDRKENWSEYYKKEEEIENKKEKVANTVEEQEKFNNTFSWSGFLFNWIWLLGSRLYKKLWIILLLFIPIVNLFVALFWLGFNGREMAWKYGRWQDFNEFRKRQKLLDKIALYYYGIILLIIIILMFVSE